jgi:hypothetical protein
MGGSGCRAVTRWGTGYQRFYLTGDTFWSFGVLSKGVEEPRCFLGRYHRGLSDTWFRL